MGMDEAAPERCMKVQPWKVYLAGDREEKMVLKKGCFLLSSTCEVDYVRYGFREP